MRRSRRLQHGHKEREDLWSEHFLPIQTKCIHAKYEQKKSINMA